MSALDKRVRSLEGRKSASEDEQVIADHMRSFRRQSGMSDATWTSFLATKLQLYTDKLRSLSSSAPSPATTASAPSSSPSFESSVESGQFYSPGKSSLRATSPVTVQRRRKTHDAISRLDAKIHQIELDLAGLDRSAWSSPVMAGQTNRSSRSAVEASMPSLSELVPLQMVQVKGSLDATSLHEYSKLHVAKKIQRLDNPPKPTIVLQNRAKLVSVPSRSSLRRRESPVSTTPSQPSNRWFSIRTLQEARDTRARQRPPKKDMEIIRSRFEEVLDSWRPVPVLETTVLD